LKISALIPTYNRGTQVLRAIQSVIEQTAPVDEIIVVDDGSTDGTAEAIRARYGPAINIFRQENRGAAAARNRGIREAQGEWIAFLDSDDVWFPSKIERQRQALLALGTEFGVCLTDGVQDGDPTKKQSVFQENGIESRTAFGALNEPAKYIDIGAGRNPFLTPSALIRLSLLANVGGFDERLVIAEDADLFFKLSFRTRFCFVAEPLVRIDRVLSRASGLLDLFLTRKDQKHESLERLYLNWLAMPEIAGTGLERDVRRSLRLNYYSSAECKIRQLRMPAALRELGKLKALGDSSLSILASLLSRKIDKTYHRHRHR